MFGVNRRVMATAILYGLVCGIIQPIWLALAISGVGGLAIAIIGMKLVNRDVSVKTGINWETEQ